MAAQVDDAEETGRGGAGGAAQAAIEVEAGQEDAASAARPDTGGETGGGTQVRPADHVEVETLVPEPLRAEVEGVAEEETTLGAPEEVECEWAACWACLSPLLSSRLEEGRGPSWAQLP